LRRPFEFTQYAAEPYRRELAEDGFFGSMSRRGNPYDKGKAERFMKRSNARRFTSRTIGLTLT
jgi:transposase InsO family protein